MISRRTFCRAAGQVSALGFYCAQIKALMGAPLGLPIGCQTYPVRKQIERDFPGTLQVLSRAGFQTIELCSPAGYARAGFAPVAKYKGAELRKLLGDMNLKCISSHFDIHELQKDLPRSIAWAEDVGLTQMMVPSLDGPRNPTRDDVKRAADGFNKIAEQIAQANMVMGLHNENFELTKVDGKRTYDMLFDLLDPKLVKFQFQVSTVSDGYDAADYFTKYPGRFISLHAQGWSAGERKIVAIGQDSLNWKKIFEAARTGGIQNYFVEMDLGLMQASVPYLRSLAA